MTDNEHTLIIRRPVQDLFRFVADVATWAQWHPSGSDLLTLKVLLEGAT